MALNLGTLFVRLEATTAEFRKSIQKVQKDLDNTAKAAQSLSAASKTAGIALSAAFGAGALAIGKMVSVASDAAEQANVIEVAFGSSADMVREWGATLSGQVGRSELDLLNFAGTTQAMLAPMIGSADAARGMSTSMAQLAVDLGSFFNVADVDALQALQSGLIGQSEPMRKFGVVMTEASLQQFAFNQGIKTQVRDMSEAQKVALRFNFIMEQTKLAQGDATRTSESFANVMKATQGALTDAARDIGQEMLPVLTDVAIGIRDAIRGFKELSPETKKVIANVLLATTAFAGLSAGFAFTFSGVFKLIGALPTLIGLGKSLSAVLAPFAAKILPAMKVGLAGIGKAILPLLIPFAALAAAILGVAAAVGAVRRGLKGKFDVDIGEQIKEGLFIPDIKKALGLDTVKAETDKLADGLKDLQGETDQAGSALADKLRKEALAASKALTSVGKAAQAGFDFEGAEVDLGLEDVLGPGLTRDPELSKGLEALEQVNREFEFAKDVGKASRKATSALNEETLRSVEGVGRVVSSMGEFGQVAGSALQAFSQSGNIMAAAGVVALELAMRTASFQRIMQMLNKLLDFAVKIVDQVLQPFIPLISVLVDLASVVLQLALLFSFFGTTLDVMSTVVRGVADIMRFFVQGVTDAFNFVIDTLADFVDEIPGLGGLAKSIRRAKIELPPGGLSTVLADTEVPAVELGDAFEDMTEGMEEFGESMDKATGALTNVPSGFKVALRRFQATAAASVDPGASLTGLRPAEAAKRQREIFIQNVNVDATDAEAFARRLKDIAEFESFTEKNTTVAAGAPFATEKQGA